MENTISAVLLGSILFLCDLFLENENCCYANYANDTTPNVAGNYTAEVLENIKNITSQSLIPWFANNQMKANHGECHLLLSTQENTNIQNSKYNL